jgi:hypothetical protein
MVFGGTALAAVFLAAVLNYVVDPYGVFGMPAVAGFNAIKPRPDAMLEDIKFIAGSRYGASALIVGNSRADVGFDPGHVAFSARQLRAYNAAVPGSGMDYGDRALRRFEGVADVRSIVVGVDFLDFLYPPDDASPPPSAPDDLTALMKTRLRALFTTTALLDSLKTLFVQREAAPAVLRSDGFNPMRDYGPIAASAGYSMLFRQRAQESAKSLVKQPHNLDVGGRMRSPAYAALRSLLQFAGESRTEVKLVIYPYHVLLLLQYDEAGLGPLFEQWEKDITAIAAEARERGVRVSLWDFSCPTVLSAEPIPPDGDRRAVMQWYWEGGHFKKELGDLVLSRIYEPAPTEVPDGFGMELTRANVEGRIAACRAALTAMRERYPSLARQAAGLAKAAAATAR